MENEVIKVETRWVANNRLEGLGPIGGEQSLVGQDELRLTENLISS